MKKVIVAMDIQNDFCTAGGVGAHYRGDILRVESAVENCQRVIEGGRASNVDVLFVRFIGDVKYQKESWLRRDSRQQKLPKCCEHTWGADFCRVRPLPTETVFTKYAHFDAFLCQGFEEHLKMSGYEELVFLGVYADVCVDSTARTGFQKGFLVTVLADCTVSLHHDFEAVLHYMTKVYGATVTEGPEFLDGLRTPADRLD